MSVRLAKCLKLARVPIEELLMLRAVHLFGRDEMQTIGASHGGARSLIAIR